MKAAASRDVRCTEIVVRARVNLTQVVGDRWRVVLEARAKWIRTAGCLTRRHRQSDQGQVGS